MISLCVISKNNEKTLRQCLSSARLIAEEIILVDHHSDDRTKEIARGFGAKIYDFKWEDNFSKSKNFALSKATGEWVLFLDADEVISRQDIEKIKELTKSEKYIGYFLIQRNYTEEIGSFSWTSTKGDTYEESKVASGFVPRKMLRLFRNLPVIKFEGVVHDSIIGSVPHDKLGETNIPIHHFGLLGRSKERLRRYIDIEKKNLKDDFFQEYQIASQLHSLGDLNDSLNHLLNSIKLNPNFYLSWLELAIISIKKDKISESRPFLTKSLELKEHQMAWSHLGIVESYEKNYSAAIRCFEKAIAMNPKNADFHYNLSQTLKLSGDIKRSKEELERAIYLNPFYANKTK